MCIYIFIHIYIYIHAHANTHTYVSISTHFVFACTSSILPTRRAMQSGPEQGVASKRCDDVYSVPHAFFIIFSCIFFDIPRLLQSSDTATTNESFCIRFWKRLIALPHRS